MSRCSCFHRLYRGFKNNRAAYKETKKGFKNSIPGDRIYESQEEQRMYKKNSNKALYNTNTVAAKEREWSYVNESLHSRFYRIGVKLFMCSIKVDSNMISWEYPKSPHPVIQLQWKQVSSENEDKDRMFFSCKCVAAEKIVIQKPLEIDKTQRTCN